jgi:hypothetical protein
MPAKPLGLTDTQFTTLINAADHVCWDDRAKFLRAVAARFAGRSEVGDGEFARGLKELLHSGFFRAPPLTGPQPRYHRPSKIRDQAPLE